jgi:hypothetical protein
MADLTHRGEFGQVDATLDLGTCTLTVVVDSLDARRCDRVEVADRVAGVLKLFREDRVQTG